MVNSTMQSGDTPVFEVRDLTYLYEEGQIALEQVSLAIRGGESVAILGSNGSGKSTLLKLLDGLYFPHSGEVCAFGQPLSEQNLAQEAFNFDFRRRVGLVFQDSDVQLFSSSVWDEVAFAPLQLGIEAQEVEQRVVQALQALRIEKLRERAPHRLSGGEKKRVAIASVLSLNPHVWLMDEPTAGLDPRSQSWLIDFILDYQRQGYGIEEAVREAGAVRFRPILLTALAIMFGSAVMITDPVFWENGAEHKLSGYVTDLLNERAAEFVGRKRRHPFALFFAHKAVHPDVQQKQDGSIDASAVATRLGKQDPLGRLGQDTHGR